MFCFHVVFLGKTPMTAIRAIRASQAYDEAYEMRRPVRPTQTAYIQVNRHSMPGYAASGSEPYYSEIKDDEPPTLQSEGKCTTVLSSASVHLKR
jgi:hypothetical protein